ncbi:hypothetical protein os4_13480 [Comamonadaceae bacterium OS-4]|nr:hypothetical protein os4_13480 [Comamonadaceae bacterium OS-4]
MVLRMIDATQSIRAFNLGRDPVGLSLKYRKMRESAFSFFRGSCHLFNERISQEPAHLEAPLAWICGDLHLENFGSYKADNRQVYFDINDFDEACLAPLSYELVRMLCSITLGASEAGLPPEESDQLRNTFLDAYATSLAQGKAMWVERETATGLIRGLLDAARKRERKDLLEKYTEVQGKKRVLLTGGKRALPATPAQKVAVAACLQGLSAAREDPTFYEVLDVAQRLAGTGSLGLERYIILVRGKGSPDGNYLLDLKRSVSPSLETHLANAQPAWPSQAHRIVDSQRRLQAISMAFLQPVEMNGAAYVLRGLLPSEDRISLSSSAHQSAAERLDLVGTMGRVVAWAHLRGSGCSGAANHDALTAFGQDARWKKYLLQQSTRLTARVTADWTAFSTALDQGALHA